MLIVLDGLIGCGKSTAIDILCEQLSSRGYEVYVIAEPVELWKTSGRLAMFYGDKKRRSFQFQIKAFHDRVMVMRNIYKQLIEQGVDVNSPDVLILMERSIFSDTIFARILYDQGFLDDSELEDYLDLWFMWQQLLPAIPDFFIYMRPSID